MLLRARSGRNFRCRSRRPLLLLEAEDAGSWKGYFMKHTALYLRVSTRSTGGRKDTRSRRRPEKLEAYCRMKGITRFRRYVDGGFSGSNLTRPAVTELVEEIAPARSSASLSTTCRLSRSQKDTLYLIEDVFSATWRWTLYRSMKILIPAVPYGRAMIKGILSRICSARTREHLFCAPVWAWSSASSRASGRAAAKYRLDMITTREGHPWFNSDADTVREIYARGIWRASRPDASRASWG